MDRLTFSQKLWLPLVVSLVVLAALWASDVYRHRVSMMQERHRDLHNVSDVAFSVIHQYAARASRGELAPGGAQLGAR